MSDKRIGRNSKPSFVYTNAAAAEFTYEYKTYGALIPQRRRHVLCTSVVDVIALCCTRIKCEICAFSDTGDACVRGKGETDGAAVRCSIVGSQTAFLNTRSKDERKKK